MDFVDADGNIVVPKAVRPVVDLPETRLGSMKCARRQYRHGSLHIRDYDTHYTVHMDKVDPRTNPLGHLLVDAPEYIFGAVAAALVGRHVGLTVLKKLRQEGKGDKDAAVGAIIAGYMAGSAAGKSAFNASNALKRRVR